MFFAGRTSSEQTVSAWRQLSQLAQVCRWCAFSFDILRTSADDILSLRTHKASHTEDGEEPEGCPIWNPISPGSRVHSRRGRI